MIECDDVIKRRRLIYTSVADCQSSLRHIADLEFLQGLLVEVRGMEGHGSRARVIERRINALRKASISVPETGVVTR